MKIRLIAVTIYVIFIFIVLPSPIKAACTCTAELSPRENLSKHDAVFTGRVTKVTRRDSTFVAYFDLIKEYKGYLGKEKDIEVQTEDPNRESSCGYSFKAGEEYVVYAKLDNSGKLNADRCSQTKTITQANENNELNELNKRRYSGTSSTVSDATERASRPVQETRQILPTDTAPAVAGTILIAATILILMGAGVGAAGGKRRRDDY